MKSHLKVSVYSSGTKSSSGATLVASFKSSLASYNLCILEVIDNHGFAGNTMKSKLKLLENRYKKDRAWSGLLLSIVSVIIRALHYALPMVKMAGRKSLSTTNCWELVSSNNVGVLSWFNIWNQDMIHK